MKAAIVHSFDKPLIIEDVPKPNSWRGELNSSKLPADNEDGMIVVCDVFAYTDGHPLLENAARNNKHPFEPEVEYTPFYLS